jgi:arylsulfatase A-like enzyme
VLSRLLASRAFYLVAAVGMIAAVLLSQLEVSRDPRPRGDVSQIERLRERDDLNVLFILIDTLRADRLSAYGYQRPTSPNLDALAANGVRFAEQMSQSSWTKCSMASLWTGLYPARTGVTRSPQALSQDARLPAEILREAGYRTFAIWRNGWIHPNFGFAQGFELYHSPVARPIPASVRREKPTVGVAGTDQDIVASAHELLRSHGRERWFLYLHLMDVHQYVYDPETALFGTRYSDIYDNSIRWVDRIVGSLIDDIDSRGLRDRTLIVVASDHGEAFGEHGREGHARDVYGEVTTTPFILSFPFRLEPGLVVETPTANVDVWPTLLDLLGLPALEGADGRSRRPQLLAAARSEPPPPPPERPLRFSHLDQAWGRAQQPPRPMVAVSDGRYRLLKRADDETGELYDRSLDPLEQRDLASEEPDVVARLGAELTRYLEEGEPPWGAAPDVELSESELEQLRALGYAPEP